MRDRLPDRREAAISTFEWGRFTWRVAIGVYPDGRGGEVFADALPVTATRIKVGSDLHGLVQDGCVLISRLIQEGVPASAIARMLGREGIDADAPAASILGRLAQVAAELEFADDSPAGRRMPAGDAQRHGDGDDASGVRSAQARPASDAGYRAAPSPEESTP